MDGMTAHRQQPFAHYINWILTQLGQNAHMVELQHSRLSFKEYSPTAPRDGRRGPRGQRRAQRTLDEHAIAEGRVDDEDVLLSSRFSLAPVTPVPHRSKHHCNDTSLHTVSDFQQLLLGFSVTG